MIFLEFIYYFVTNTRNFLFDKRILPIKKVDGVNIVCVGNISIGGTGKTPAVQYLVGRYLALGKKVAIISRGYGRKKTKEPLLVSDGNEIYCSPEESGDEPYMHALNLNIPVIVGSNRYKACIFAKNNFDIDTIILDDGFQHRKLHRDKDIVLIDATNPFGGKALLPRGILRENFVKAGFRASEFIITKVDLVPKKTVSRVKNFLKIKFKKNVSLANHSVIMIVDKEGNEKPLSLLENKKILLFSALANPINFEKTVASLKPLFVERIDFRDHHKFTIEDITLIKKRAFAIGVDYILTTEKDAVKLYDFNINNLHILKIKFELIEDNINLDFGG